MNMTCTDTLTNTSSAGEESLVPLESLSVYLLAQTLCKICYAVIILVGTFGNVMSIVIMSRMTSQESTINIFFIAIAVGDLLVLYTGTLPHWIEVTWGIVMMTWPVLQHMLRWIASFSGATVNWLLVCMTLQRTLSVLWPHHVHRVCTKRKVRFLIVGIALFMASLYVPYLLRILATYNVHTSCNGRSSSDFEKFLNEVFSNVDLVVFSLLPFSCLIVGNGLLASKLVISGRKAREKLTAGKTRQLEEREKVSQSVTITVIVVSMTFVVLTLPPCVYFTFYNFKGFETVSAQGYLFSTISLLLADSNSAVNFYLYCLTGRRFRKEFVKIACCRHRAESSRAKTSLSTISAPSQGGR